MNIPPLDITVCKGAVNGQIVDVIDYDEYSNHIDMYENRTDVAIKTKKGNDEYILPIKGEYNPNAVNPGIYNAGCVDFVIYPSEEDKDNYSAKNIISMSNKDNIIDLIKAGDEAKRLDEDFITSPDNITSIPIKVTDQPELKCLKMALNAKKIDIDKYAGRFGDNYPNDKRQLKNSSATLNIIKRYCDNCDMEAILTLRDKSPDVPNPMGCEISVSLTKFDEDEEEVEVPVEDNDDDDDSSEYSDE